MPARVIVYCAKAVQGVTAPALTAALHDADLVTLAEALELPEGEEAAVDAMWKHLRIEAEAGGDYFTIHWHATQRPITLALEPPLANERGELLEMLGRARSAGARRVREHLARVRHVAAFELGIDGSLHVAATICEVLAFAIAERADGLVWFYHREWVAPDDRGATLWKARA